jgi:photosystem II stability/assembly factor-like uncharacterized protein
MKALYPEFFFLFLFLSLAGIISAQSGLETDTSFLNGLQYRSVGPTRGGRVTAVAGVEQQPSTFYMGATGGGVWKTTDYGQNWACISDGYFSTPSIGAIRTAPSQPNTVYVGTGSDGLRSNVITGKGVYKSEDGGKTWQFKGLEKTGLIGAVEVHPRNPDIAFVAAIGQPFQPNPERGVYRTRDGGKTWDHVLFLADTIGVADLELCPDNPDVIYAAAWRAERKPWTIISGGMEGGVYKSIDGGDTWRKLENGLPQGLIGKIDLAVSPADPNRLYALVEAPPGEGGLYRSDDRGESFRLVSDNKELLRRPFYFLNVDANPLNADAVYVNSLYFMYSADGGKSWSRRRTPHIDNHDMWINPQDTLLFIQANDGGVNVTRDGGKTWSSQENQPTAELYQVDVDDQYPYWLYAGQQDNTTIALPSLPPYPSTTGPSGYWLSVGGCETGPAVPKPGDPDIVYSNCKGRFSVYNKRTGQDRQYYVGAGYIYGHNPKDLPFRFQRVAPIHVSPHNPDVVYHASQFLHKTTDDGQTWETISPDLTAFEPDKQVISGGPITRDITGEEFYSAIYEVQESPLKEGLIWVGANDGPVHVTRNGGRDWENVTPSDLLPGGRIDCVEPSPHKEGKAYFSALRYQMGDWKPYIFKTEDYGRSWTLLTTGRNGIPMDYPTRVVREDPQKEGLLYAGTEFGMFVSFDDGKNWRPFRQNLPVTPVTDIKVHRGDLVLSTMGRGFWILDDISVLHQLPKGEVTEARLFKPRDTHGFRYRASSPGSVPYYPAAGVSVGYYLPDTAAEEVVMEILTLKGEVIRAFTSGSQPKDSARTDEPDMSTGFLQLVASPGLPVKPGLNRFIWDMRHAGPWHKESGRRRQGGPMATPGEYVVRLKVGDREMTQSFRLLADPRLVKEGIGQDDLQAQEELALQIRLLQSQARLMEHRVKERRKELAGILKKEEATPRHRAEDEWLVQLEDELSTAEGIYMQPKLVDQIGYLANMLDEAGQRPGADAYRRFEELKIWFDKLAGIWEKNDRGGEERVD